MPEPSIAMGIPIVSLAPQEPEVMEKKNQVEHV
jgi:hypothetical protein